MILICRPTLCRGPVVLIGLFCSVRSCVVCIPVYVSSWRTTDEESNFLTVCPDKCEPLSTRLVFLIDGSESISPEHFNDSLQWVLDTVGKFRDKDSRELRVTAVQYSENANPEIQNERIEASADEIKSDIESIVQIREGTKPYTSLDYINKNVDLDNSFYNVLITLGDGRSRNEVKNINIINAAKRNYNVMLSVGLGDDLDMSTLLDFAHRSVPFPINDTVTLDGNINNITKESHEGM